MNRNAIIIACLVACIGGSMVEAAGKLEITIVGGAPTPRITYATEQVRAACDAVSVSGSLEVSVQGVGGADKLKPEGFRLKSMGGNAIAVIGADQSGVLYGCLELAGRIRAGNAIPANLDMKDAPEFKLRGPCIAMQKLGGAYLHPYTPEKFPFFYDKAHWTEYLDFLVGIRMNSLYLWNGHPFASLVKLDDYPEAAEVSSSVWCRPMRPFQHSRNSRLGKREGETRTPF